MTLTDLLIIYLAFGAPLAVYKYLQNRTVGLRQRIALSIFTFFVWVPAAVHLGYLYLANAYFGDAFVSHGDSDASDQRIRGLREAITAELMRLCGGTNLHDTRETLDRYSGLANEVRNAASVNSGRSALFEAAGRKDDELAQLCLMRRNLRRLQRHHIQARRDFVDLLDRVPVRFAAMGVIGTSIDLARRLEDRETVELLTALMVKRGEVWSSAQQGPYQAITQIPPISMTASLNND